MLARLVASAISNRLRDPKAQVSAILGAYDAVRRPIAAKAAAMSKNNALYWTLLSSDDTGRLRPLDTRSDEEVNAMHCAMSKNWDISWDKQSTLAEAERAIAIFRRELSQPQPRL